MDDINVDNVDVTQTIEREWVGFSDKLREMVASGRITHDELERSRVTFYAAAYAMTRVVARLGNELLPLENGPTLLAARLGDMQAEVGAQLHLARVTKRTVPPAQLRKGFRAVFRKR